MEIGSFEDVLKLQQEFSARIQTSMNTLAAGAGSTAENMIAAKREALKQSQAAMATLSRAKDEAIKRFDEELHRYEIVITQLERELEAINVAAGVTAKVEFVDGDDTEANGVASPGKSEKATRRRVRHK